MKFGIRNLTLPLAAAGALLVASCATAPPALHDSDLDRLANRINTADVAQLVNGSAPVFLLDSEVYHRTSDIEYLWQKLVAAGFKVKPPFTQADAGNSASAPGSSVAAVAFSAPVPVSANSYSSFGDGFQPKGFFERYVPANSYLVDVATTLGTFRLIVAAGHPSFIGPDRYSNKTVTPSSQESPVIVGMTGPIDTGGAK